MEGQVDQLESVISTMVAANGTPCGRREWNCWNRWKGAALLIAALVLPFGWIVPVAELARVRVASRRR